MQTVSGPSCQCCCYSAPHTHEPLLYIVLTSFPHTLSIITGLPTEHSLVPGTVQVSDLLSTRWVHITMHLILLGAPVTSLQVMRTKSNLRRLVVYACWLSIDHLDKRELTGALVTISDYHLTIVVHPSLATQQVVDTRGDLPPIMIRIPTTQVSSHTLPHSNCV